MSLRYTKFFAGVRTNRDIAMLVLDSDRSTSDHGSPRHGEDLPFCVETRPGFPGTGTATGSCCASAVLPGLGVAVGEACSGAAHIKRAKIRRIVMLPVLVASLWCSKLERLFDPKYESRHHSFRFMSSNGMTRSTLPLESRIRISPERKHARPVASSIASS